MMKCVCPFTSTGPHWAESLGFCFCTTDPVGLEPRTNGQRREVPRSGSGTISFFCTQALISALSRASAYLDVVAKLDLCCLEEAITLQQPGS